MVKKLFFLWAVFLFVYLFIAGRGKFRFGTRWESYFNLQAYSWLQGHLDLVIYPQNKFDLSVYNGKVYTYWPPLPALFVLPFVYLFGIAASDVFYTAFYGSFGPLLMYLVMKTAIKAKIIPKISEKYVLLLTIFFAF